MAHFGPLNGRLLLTRGAERISKSGIFDSPGVFELRTFRFYKKGCQEKKLPRELEAAKIFGIQPPCCCAGASRRSSARVVCLKDGEMFRCQGHKFPNPPFPHIRKVLFRTARSGQGRAVSARRQRTLDGEDRSETVCKEGKEEFQLDSISEAQQAKRLHLYMATIVLSETRGL
jgi:hypothetical protein